MYFYNVAWWDDLVCSWCGPDGGMHQSFHCQKYLWGPGQLKVTWPPSVIMWSLLWHHTYTRTHIHTHTTVLQSCVYREPGYKASVYHTLCVCSLSHQSYLCEDSVPGAGWVYGHGQVERKAQRPVCCHSNRKPRYRDNFALSIPSLSRLLSLAFEGLLPRDNPKNTRFSINFFTSIGLGGLTYVCSTNNQHPSSTV